MVCIVQKKFKWIWMLFLFVLGNWVYFDNLWKSTHSYMKQITLKHFKKMGVLILAIMCCKLILVNIGGIMKQVENFN
jgi:hypothetical protein